MPELRVAFVITELDVGGAERCLANVATRLDRRRFDPAVYCLAPAPANDELVRQLRDAGVPVHFLDARSPWQFWRVRTRLRRLLTRQAPHVVQSFLFHANVTAAFAAPGVSGARLSLGLRVADPSRGRLWLETWAARRADRVVCVSREIAEVLRAGATPAEKVVVIPNGIDVSRFDALAGCGGDPLPVSADRKLLVSIGRLHPQKGLDWFLRLCPNLLAALPNHDVLLVGDGPQRTELRKLVASLRLESRVHLTGRRGDVPAILARGDLLVLPSRWEGMPNVVLEAMAARRAVVCAQAAGVAELLGEAAPRQTARFGDAAAFSARLISLAQDPAASAALGDANRARVEREFSLQAVVERYERLFESL